MTASADFDQTMKRLEELLSDVERRVPEDGLETVRELVRVLLDVHRIGLDEMFQELVLAQGEAKIRAFSERPSVASLLLMHDLHPQGLEERIDRAMDEAHAAAGQHARAEVVQVEGKRVLVRVRGEKPAATALLRRAIERVVDERAPDALLEVDGGDPLPEPGIIPVERLFARGGSAAE